MSRSWLLVRPQTALKLSKTPMFSLIDSVKIILHAYHFDGFCQITLFYIYHLNLNKRGLHLIGFMNTALQIPNCFNYKSSDIIENYYDEIFLHEKLHSQSFLYLKCFFLFLKFWV